MDHCRVEKTHPTRSERLTFRCEDGFEMGAYLTRPDLTEPMPGMVFIFDTFGVWSEMMRIADEVAEYGYAVIIPDLYARRPAFLCVLRVFRDLFIGAGRTVSDLLSARAWLSEQSFVNGERMATMGICLGGGFALLLAKTGQFQGAADFYGLPPHSLEGACPIVASIGDRDGIVHGKTPAMFAEIERHSIAADIKVYAGAGHAFMTRNPNRLLAFALLHSPAHSAYDPAVAKDAMERMRHFLALHV